MMKRIPVEEMQRVVKMELTNSEVSCFYATFSSQALLLVAGRVRDRDIATLYMKIQRIVKVATKTKLVSAYSFESLMLMSFGLGSTVLQYVLKGSDLNCAEIGDIATISSKARIARFVHENQHVSFCHVCD
jgi:hypothetical protein